MRNSVCGYTAMPNMPDKRTNYDKPFFGDLKSYSGLIQADAMEEMPWPGNIYQNMVKHILIHFCHRENCYISFLRLCRYLLNQVVVDQL